MNRITQQTWDQLVTQALALVGLAITIGNQVGWWSVGDDATQSIITALTLVLAFAATLIYGVNSTPNRVVDQIEAESYHAGYDRALAREDIKGI